MKGTCSYSVTYSVQRIWENLALTVFPLPNSAVIQDVENSSLEVQYQSFASLMEERLAELLMVAHQQGIRFRRATTVDSYTVQVCAHGTKVL